MIWTRVGVLVLALLVGCGGETADDDDTTTGDDDTTAGDDDDTTAGDDDDVTADDDDAADDDDSAPHPVTPVYVTVAGHIEDLLAYMDCPYYDGKRAALLDFADVVSASGVAFNLQVSYEWFVGVNQCETPEMMAATDGMNVIDYLVQTHGFEIDIHQEGASVLHASSGNNFADIRYMGGQVTSAMSETTGFQWDNPAQYAGLQAGEQGLLHPVYVFVPEILAGGASVDHVEGDFSRDMTSIGVWIPSDFTEADFHVHDTSASARMVYVGSGPNQWCSDWALPGPDCHWINTPGFVSVLADYLADGRLEPGRIYTSTLFVPQSIIFDSEHHADFAALLAEYTPLHDAGVVEYAHFTEVVDVWRTLYASEPNVVQYDVFDPADYTCGP